MGILTRRELYSSHPASFNRIDFCSKGGRGLYLDQTWKNSVRKGGPRPLHMFRQSNHMFHEIACTNNALRM